MATLILECNRPFEHKPYGFLQLTHGLFLQLVVMALLGLDIVLSVVMASENSHIGSIGTDRATVGGDSMMTPKQAVREQSLGGANNSQDSRGACRLKDSSDGSIAGASGGEAYLGGMSVPAQGLSNAGSRAAYFRAARLKGHAATKQSWRGASMTEISFEGNHYDRNLDKWIEMFEELDVDKSGILEVKGGEIARAISTHLSDSFNFGSVQYLAPQIIMYYDSDMDGAWILPEFLAFATSASLGALGEDISLFLACDVSHKGFMMVDELGEFMMELYTVYHWEYLERNFEIADLDSEMIPDGSMFFSGRGEFENIHRQYDSNRDGKLQAMEFVELMHNEAKMRDVVEGFIDFDMDGDGSISREELEEVMHQSGWDTPLPVDLREYLELRTVVDEHIKSGQTEQAAAEILKLQEMREVKQIFEVDELLSSMDGNNDGKVNFAEFRSYFNSAQLLDISGGLVIG